MSPSASLPSADAVRPSISDPSWHAVLAATAICLALVVLTRVPIMRERPMESDEFGFLSRIQSHWFPMHHTLFLTSAKFLGNLAGEPYRGFLLMDMLTSALALASTWWWLRALVPPAVAAAGTLLLCVAPVFWGYGAMAGNYTAIIAVGAFLLGVAWRSAGKKASWQPIAAAVVLALGTGYRQDIGTLWLPVFVVILFQHRWWPALRAGLIFILLNLAWLLAMLHDVGGWAQYRTQSAEFAYSAGYLNSVWKLGFVDAPLRYGVKLAMALLWTFGPALAFAPRGLLRLGRIERGGFLCFLLFLSVLPALGSHLLVHFGVPGYAFHYVPAVLALAVLGIGRAPAMEAERQAPLRLCLVAAVMAGVFLFYPTDFDRPGWRGAFDLSFARHTRIGLRAQIADRQPALWRTANSRDRAQSAF
jgi:hypothetical protein